MVEGEVEYRRLDDILYCVEIDCSGVMSQMPDLQRFAGRKKSD